MTAPDIHRGVLDNLLDGVLVVGAGGRIETLNPAAERILGLQPGAASGGSFAELLIAREGLDEFTELILAATARGSDPERRVVDPGIRGVVRSVSAEADPKNSRKALFNVTFLLDELDVAALARNRSGMSAKLRIVTYDNLKALLVPLAAVRRRGGKHWLRVLDEGGEVHEREVAIGPTTRRRVKIASGLKPGERVVVPDG